MIHLAPHSEGTLLFVKVQPGAKRNAICGEHNGMLKVAVCQSPERGKANRAVVDAVCRQLQLRSSQVELLTGQTSREKRFLIRGITPEILGRRIAAVLAK